MTNAFRGGYFAVNKQALERLPFRPVDFSELTDKVLHDRMVVLVEQMLDFNKQKHSDKLDTSELKTLEGEIASTDAEIENLVYQLYGITDEERKIIEG